MSDPYTRMLAVDGRVVISPEDGRLFSNADDECPECCEVPLVPCADGDPCPEDQMAGDIIATIAVEAGFEPVSCSCNNGQAVVQWGSTSFRFVNQGDGTWLFVGEGSLWDIQCVNGVWLMTCHAACTVQWCMANTTGSPVEGEGWTYFDIGGCPGMGHVTVTTEPA